jgi:hypothetical protein
MTMHQVTGTLYKKAAGWPHQLELVDELKEEYFSIYNAHRRASELEYLGYNNVKLIDANQKRPTSNIH